MANRDSEFYSVRGGGGGGFKPVGSGHCHSSSVASAVCSGIASRAHCRPDASTEVRRRRHEGLHDLAEHHDLNRRVSRGWWRGAFHREEEVHCRDLHQHGSGFSQEQAESFS